MGDALGNIKRILSNKNTVTILGILLGVVVIYFAYNYRVKKAVEPISVPMAKQEIQAGEKITDDMIEYVDISRSMLNKSPGIIVSDIDIVGKKVVSGQSIPEHGLFYTDQLNSSDDTTTIVSNIPDGYTIFTLKVDFNSTYGNSIYPGNYIDIYMKALNEDGQLMVGKLIENVKVLAVKDSKGQNILKNKLENGKPSELLFAVEEDIYLLLMKAQNAKGIDVTITPVLRNSNYTEKKGKTEVSSDELKAFILDRCVEM